MYNEYIMILSTISVKKIISLKHGIYIENCTDYFCKDICHLKQVTGPNFNCWYPLIICKTNELVHHSVTVTYQLLF